jgi:hypothetical protein
MSAPGSAGLRDEVGGGLVVGDEGPGDHCGRLRPVPAGVQHTVRLDRVRAHRGDMLRVAGSLTLGEVLSRASHQTWRRLRAVGADLQDPAPAPVRRRRGIPPNGRSPAQRHRARHRLARKIFFGQRGELRQRYREGMEDQLGALGLTLNDAVVLFDSPYIDAAPR